MFDTNVFHRGECAVFRKTEERFGGLSNMCGGFPIFVNKSRILTTEHLYQMCRFPDLPEVQREIMAEKSPMGAKMKSKPHRPKTRPDWESADGLGVRVDVMRWCLRLKLAQNFVKFKAALLETGSRDIVEDSHNDPFWGAVPVKGKPNELEGRNVLGRLLVELREELAAKEEAELKIVAVPGIPNFLLFGTPIVGRA